MASDTDTGLVDELAALAEKAFSPNRRDWYVPWRVIPDGGKPTIAGSHSGNLFRGVIGTWQDADLVVALVNNLPAILAALSRPSADFAAVVEQDITVEDHVERIGGKTESWHEVREAGRYLCTCCERADADRIAAAIRSIQAPDEGLREALQPILDGNSERGKHYANKALGDEGGGL